ncbi:MULTISPECIES: XrtA system polysaccharide chain length determinant [unclassified Agarivorans]|uniref:XrtA system polysaccharide chain length determinant n=1 Tax=unclassified Agarivorans TaxID=2636026 RepID=UPI0010E402A6|nr:MULTISPECIES: XrtA system polysaccharide chain length determinant [unclassified Agarivorans]MDO6763572.1 GNVR domain-containing protein [Agarivorans sp. 1_MG-2023]GDY26798.1 chain-length determining protein [Agarivorans sp. Toyoura001]
MQELIEDFLQYLRGVWLKRRYILIALWVICPIGWIAVTLMPNQYTAEARVYADTRSLLQPLLKGLAIQTDPSQELAMIVKTLLSRNNLEKIARASDADVRVNNSAEYDELLDNLKEKIDIDKTRRENLYTITFVADSPQYVRDVVQAALDVFVENTLGEKRQDTDTANSFINQQIEEYETRLIEAEKRLASFKQEYTAFLPGKESTYYSNLEGVKKLLEETRLELSEAETKLVSARSQLASEELLASQQTARVRTEFDDRIISMQTRLDDLLLRYTERHPDVVEVQRQIESLQKQKDNAITTAKTPAAIASESVIYQDLKITVSQLENEVASLKVREERHAEKVDTLQEQLRQVPDVEAKLTGLNRNYEITKSKYEDLLSRRESAQISQSAGKTTDDIKFRVIDAPRVPLVPSGPKRPLLIAGVLIFALAVGGGMSFAFSQINPVVSSLQQLYQQTGYPVLGVVSATESSGLMKIEKRKMRLFVLSNTVLLCGFVGFMVINLLPGLHNKIIAGLGGVGLL